MNENSRACLEIPLPSNPDIGGATEFKIFELVFTGEDKDVLDRGLRVASEAQDSRHWDCSKN
jgi:hypothetical protein